MISQKIMKQLIVSGAKCYIQKSSLASENAIWLDVADANAQIMVSDAVKLELIKIENPCG